MGEGEDGLISTEDTIEYTIHFENKAQASAAAQRVLVVDQLDDDLDWSTFRLRDVQIADHCRQRVALDALGHDLLSGYSRSPGAEHAPCGPGVERRFLCRCHCHANHVTNNSNPDYEKEN